MHFDDFLLTDTSGKKSSTLTAFAIGFVVVNFKLLFSELTVYGITFSSFSGVDYGTGLAALGAIYVLRRSTDSNKRKKDV